jgi:hypothetical protein
MTRFLAFVALAAVLAVAGCGGGDDESSAEAWADDVCTSANSWTEELVQIAADVDPSAGAEGIEQQLDQAEKATRNLLEDVRDVGAPDTQGGSEAQEEIEGLVERTQDRLDSLRGELEGASTGEALSVLGQAAQELEAVGTDARDTLDRIQELDPAGELRQGIEGADSCQELRDRAGE